MGSRREKAERAPREKRESRAEPRRALGWWHGMRSAIIGWPAHADSPVCEGLSLLFACLAGGLLAVVPHAIMADTWHVHAYIHAHTHTHTLSHTHNTTCVHTVTQHAWWPRLSSGGHAHDAWAAALSLTCSAGCRSNNNDGCEGKGADR